MVAIIILVGRKNKRLLKRKVQKMRITPAKRLITAANCLEPDMVPVSISFKPIYFRKWLRASGRQVGEDLASKLEVQLELPSQHWSCETVRGKLKSAKTPDPYNDGWMPEALNDWQKYIDHMPSEVRRKYGGIPWTFGVPGPLGSVGTLLSYPETFRLLYEDTEFLHELLEFHTTSVVLWIRAVEQVFTQSGLDTCRFFVAEEMLPMISPDHAKEFCLPYLRRIYEASQSAIKIFHCDNRVTHMPDVITSLGANVFFGNFSDYRVLKETFGGKMALMGNVPSLHVLTEGKPKDVEESCKWLIARCGPGGGFILSSGGGLDPSGNTPLENIDAMVNAAEEYGKYPLTVSVETSPARYCRVMSLHFSRSIGETQRIGESALDVVAEQTCLGNVSEVREAVRKALETKINPKRTFWEGLCHGLTRATGLFYQEQYFYPEMDRADKAFQAGLTALGSSFKSTYFKGTVVIGSMKGSFQESGIRVIQVMLQGSGLKVINLGMGIDPERFIDEAVKASAQVIAMGVYFYQHVELAERVTSMLRKKGLHIKTLAGGMGITPKIAEELAVDAYAADGIQAQNKALVLISLVEK
jgi:5-methyltetrahydrofolate--homocysteine methyltransferase